MYSKNAILRQPSKGSFGEKFTVLSWPMAHDLKISINLPHQ